MRNPLQSLPMFNPAVPQGTFTRSFMKGATSGALMMGIFSALMLAGSIVGLTAAPSLVMFGLGTVATGLFSGVMGTQRAAETATSANTVSHSASRAPVRAREQAVAPALDQAVHNQRAWTQRVSSERSSSQDRVGQILADRSLSDGDRAAAILRDREQSSTLNASR